MSFTVAWTFFCNTDFIEEVVHLSTRDTIRLFQKPEISDRKLSKSKLACDCGFSRDDDDDNNFDDGKTSGPFGGTNRLWGKGSSR
mmetsp:Transcript_15861/g.36181  ORF Transcript_15861/g.36181 Transcript_15861/m.36181 type:complete len:85 (-) Transcript_15861:411-665(-)